MILSEINILFRFKWLTNSGIEAAYKAGIGHIIALGPAGTHHRLIKLKGVNRVVETLKEIPKERLFYAI